MSSLGNLNETVSNKTKKGENNMTYTTYLKFYGLEKNKQTRENWLFNEWLHGRVYQYNGKFFSTTTGEEIK